MYDSTYVRPLRQPYNPPEVSLIQKHAGFARFLKQHASPPHHRVTAGGRIVPAGPLSPPPMMLLPYSLDTVVAGTEKSNANKPQTTLAQTDRKVSGIPKTPVGPSAAPLTQQHVNIDQVKQDQELDTFANPQYAQFQPTLGQNGPSFGPTPFGTTPIGFLPDGSSFVLYNGANYQNFWDGRSVVMKPLQLSAPTLPQTGYNPMLYPQMAGGGQYYGLYGLDGPHQDTNGSMPTTNGKSQALNEPQQLSAAQPEGPQAAHERLTSELNALDKYAALHLHEFSAIENTQYTSRRRQLVQQLDSLRAVTENDRLAPGFGPRALAAPSWLSANNVSESSNTHLVNSSASNIQTAGPTTPCNANAAPVHLPNLGLNQRLAPPRTSNNKCLSPDAPPFIPSGAKAAGPDYFGTDQRSGNTGTKSWERRAVTRGTIAGGLSAQKIHDQPDGSVRTSEGKIMGPGEIDRDSSPTDLRRYLRAEPHEPETLPVVTFSDIEYANVPGFNPVGKPKLYCTTIWEFQEVLRRVREQAQLYGCKGGQSKDPAYDAEQDIRWAMADGEPIPLPKSPADHVAHPRPWSWDDSAFNYRPEVAISPAGSKSHAHEEVQQSLSHHVGKTTRSRADSWTTNPSLEDFTVGGRASSSDNHKQHQRHEQDVSGPPAKSKTDGGCIMPIAGLSEQSQNTQQVAASSIQELSRSTYWPSSRSTKRQGSRIGDVGINLMLNSTDDDGDRDSDALSFDSQGIPRPHFIDPGKR